MQKSLSIQGSNLGTKRCRKSCTVPEKVWNPVIFLQEYLDSSQKNGKFLFQPGMSTQSTRCCYHNLQVWDQERWPWLQKALRRAESWRKGEVDPRSKSSDSMLNELGFTYVLVWSFNHPHIFSYNVVILCCDKTFQYNSCTIFRCWVWLACLQTSPPIKGDAWSIWHIVICLIFIIWELSKRSMKGVSFA